MDDEKLGYPRRNFFMDSMDFLSPKTRPRNGPFGTLNRVPRSSLKSDLISIESSRWPISEVFFLYFSISWSHRENVRHPENITSSNDSFFFLRKYFKIEKPFEKGFRIHCSRKDLDTKQKYPEMGSGFKEKNFNLKK